MRNIYTIRTLQPHRRFRWVPAVLLAAACSDAPENPPPPAPTPHPPPDQSAKSPQNSVRLLLTTPILMP